MPIQRINLTNKVFGRLTVVSYSHHVDSRTRPGSYTHYWNCLCDCGNYKTVIQGHLKSGNVSSCGCYRKEWASANAKTHGDSTSPLYNVWAQMLARCNNPTHFAFDRYGGRGIKVCDRWLSYENFKSDMGERPTPEHSIDRFPDNNGNYEPSNCRWATAEQQANNRRHPKQELLDSI